MNFPWDKSYFKACFYAVLTFVLIYMAKLAMDAIAYTFVNIGVVYGVLLELISRLCSVFSIIIAGFAIAYILKPLTVLAQRKIGISKMWATALTFICVLIVVIAIFAALYFTIYINRNKFDEYVSNLKSIYYGIKIFFEDKNMTYAVKTLDNIKFMVNDYINVFSDNIVDISKNIVAKIATLLLSLVTAFYMLRDEKTILSSLRNYTCVIIGEKRCNSIVSFLSDADKIFSKYVAGQLTDGVVMAGLLSVGLAVVKVPFAVAIGVVSGLLNIIPYFGSVFGFVLAILTALVSGAPIRALYAAITIIVLQQIDSAFLVPRIVGDSVRLSPLMVIISIAVGGRLLGLWGMVFAVPVVALLKLRFDRFCNKKTDCA